MVALRLFAVVCVVAVGVAVAVPALGAGPGGAPPRAAFSGSDPDFGAGLGRVVQRRERLRTADAKRERQRSRARYRDASRAEALDAGQRAFPDEFTGRVFRGSEPMPGLRTVRTLGRGTGVVQDGAGRRLLVASSLPLESKNAAGDERPVDLALTESAAAFESVNPLVGVRVAKRARGGVAFGDKDTFKVVPGSDGDVAGGKESDRVFFANALTDSDVLVAPRPAGAEIGWQLRSAASPERLVLNVDMPAGALLRRARTARPIPGDPPRAIEIAKGDKALGYVYPPNAYDADGSPVRSHAEIDGDRIVVRVDHRDADARYPIFVDPEVGLPNTSWYWPGWGHFQTPSSASQGNNYYGVALANCAYYCAGIYLSMPTNTTYSPSGTGVNWYYQAPANTYVYRAAFANMAHAPLLNGYAFSLWYQGLLAPSGHWEQNINYVNQSGGWGPNPFGPAGHGASGVTHDFCFNPRCSRYQGSEQNYALFGLGAYNPYTGAPFSTGPYKATLTMSHAGIYLGDRRAPAITSAKPADRDWTDDTDNRTHTLGTSSASDLGLGVYGISLTGAASGNTTRRPSCNGYIYNPAQACPANWSTSGLSYTLNEGINTLSLQAHDIVDNNSTKQTWSERIDRSAPELAVAGDLRDLASGVDDSGRDLYGLNITATDGTPAAPRVGVRDVLIKVDGAEYERLDSDADCIESCAVSDEVFLDTDELSEGPHTVSVQAFDRLGHASSAITWTIRVPREEYYAGKLSSWKADVEQRVDNAVPIVPLSGPMPSPPDGWRHEADCEASTGALRACYEAIQTWGASVSTWLSSNLAVLSLAGELPDPPTFEYTKAADSTSLELTRTMRDTFKLSKTALASPLERLNLAITFHEPAAPSSVLQAIPQLAVAEQVALTGVFDPDGGDLSGTSTSPTATLLTEAIDDFYTQQIAIAQEDLTEVQAIVPEDADEAEANQQFINEHQAFVSALQARQPFITGLGAKMTLPELLESLVDLDAAQIIKSIRLLPPNEHLLGNGLELLTGTRTNTAVVRSAQRRQAATTRAGTATRATAAFPSAPAQPRCYDAGAGGSGPMRRRVTDPTPTYWAPSRESYNTSIGVPDGDHHMKVHRLRWRWKAADSLAWMCSDDPGDRNVEIEAMVYPDDDERWSDNWESNNARKYTQHNGPAGGNIHQDDIASGDNIFQVPPGYPFDKARFPDFSIVFQSSQEFRYRRLYKVRFVTNEGETDDTDSRVIYSVQATKRASGKTQQGYCTSRARDYKSCMFNATTACVAHEPIAAGFRHARIDWRDIMGSEATRLTTLRRRNSPVVDDKFSKVTARCDARPPGSGR